MTDPGILRELFEACKSGDLVKVKKLMTSQNVNEIDTAGRRSSALHFASGYGRKNVVEYLLANGANINLRDDGGLNCLHNAASFGHQEVVQILLDAGADPNLQDNWGFSALHEASAKGKVEVCLALLRHGGNWNLRNSEGKTPIDLADPTTKPILTGEYRKDELLEAARLGDELKLLELLNPLNVNCHAMDGRRSTPLHLASGYNRVKVVQILLQNGADCHEKDKGGLVSLHNSASYGHLEVSQLLIKSGANVNAADLWQFTPLHEAAQKGRAEVCSLLISEGADINFLNCHNKSPLDLAPRDLQERMAYEYKGIQLLSACRECDITRVKKFLTSQTISFAHPFTGDQALHVIAMSAFPKRKQILEFLIRKGAQLNIKNKDLLSPLALSSKFANYDIMDCLIRNGANINITDGLGQTCLHQAAKDDDVQAVRLLLSHAADPDVVSLQGYTPSQVAKENVLKIFKEEKKGTKELQESTSDLESQLLEASKSGDLTTVKKIISLNSRIVNCRDSEGRNSTPLHFASGYNRVSVVEYLLEHSADVHASDKGGLVPLHNSSSYGHLEVSQMLIKYGANVNALDLWKFSPLHEASAKGKYEIVKLLLKHGADPKLKNRDNATPLDLAKDQEIADLLRGNAALLDAAKKGDLARVKKLLTSDNINCRDVAGRNSTPLHLAAGYNNYEVVEYLLENGANVNSTDKGGLIALHNASSFGHLEIAAILIKYNTQVDAVDKWGFTPLHEASQKGRTQLCSLLLAHGADPFLTNQEGQTALDLCTAEDVKSLLQDAMFARQPLNVSTSSSIPSTTTVNESTELITLPSGNQVELPVIMSMSSRSCLSPIQGIESNIDNVEEDKTVQSDYSDISSFLSKLKLEHLSELFEREQITLEILTEMGHEDLKNVGVTAYGYRHKILKGIAGMKSNRGVTTVPVTPATILIDLLTNDKEYLLVEEEMQSTIREHLRDGGNMGGVFNRYNILRIQKIQNQKLWNRYMHRRAEIAEEIGGQYNEKVLFHGSPFINAIIQKGFDERHAYIGG
ncbi:hypothetical protein ACKWTF_009276 [Chironomus riparius]